jgi:ribosome maturation factor RimP
MAATHEQERRLTREIARKVETALPETEVLAVELTGPDGFTVFIDDLRGVDHALCQRVTDLLTEYRREWNISVSSPGVERPLRRPDEFARRVGEKVKVRTARPVEGARSMTGVIVEAGPDEVRIATEAGERAVPFDDIESARTVFEWGPPRPVGKQHARGGRR